MGTTPLGFVYPDATDDPNIPADMQALAEGIDTYITSMGVFTSYTPDLSAVTTPPTMGTGSSVSGKYARIGDLVYGSAIFNFGSTGVSAGSGNYLLKLPVTAAAPLSGGSPMGRARISDNSASSQGYLDVCVHPSFLDYAFIRYQASWPTGTLNSVTNSAPWTWAASDVIEMWFCYEAA